MAPSAAWNVARSIGVVWTGSPILEIDVELSTMLFEEVFQLIDVVVASSIQ
jgi:hypothetical protein